MSAVSVRRRIDAAAPSAQAMSSRMMKSRRRVEGEAQPAMAPAGVVGRAEREARADIFRNILPYQLSYVKKIVPVRSCGRRYAGTATDRNRQGRSGWAADMMGRWSDVSVARGVRGGGQGEAVAIRQHGADSVFGNSRTGPIVRFRPT